MIRALCLAVLAAAALAEDGIPEELTLRIEAYRALCARIDADAAAKVAVERRALVKALTRVLERETKAKRADVAALVQEQLDAVGGGAADAGADAGPAGDVGWDEFLKQTHVISQGYQDTGAVTGGTAQISSGGYTMVPKRGMNVCVLVRGAPVIERAYLSETDLNGQLPLEFAAVPEGAYVIMAMQDEIYAGAEPKINEIIRRCGGRHAIKGPWSKLGYILIGRVGAKAGDAIELIAQSGQKVLYPAPAKE